MIETESNTRTSAVQDFSIQKFQHEKFGEIRITDKEGTPWFVANDIAVALGYEKPNNAINKYCKKVNKFNYPVTGRSLNIISESDVFRLIMRSKLPSAIDFQDWVVEEVLPSIRKHGFYGTDDFVEQALSDPDKMISILQQYKFERQQRQLAEHQRDEAVRTKAYISDKKTATAMATASKYSRENERLKTEVGNSKEWKQAKAISWLSDFFDLKNRGVYIQVGKQLSKISRRLGHECKKVESVEFGTVKAYRVEAIESFKHMLNADLNMMRNYRI